MIACDTYKFCALKTDVLVCAEDRKQGVAIELPSNKQIPCPLYCLLDGAICFVCPLEGRL